VKDPGSAGALARVTKLYRSLFQASAYLLTRV
jgi:hypothetical protein